MHQRYLIRLVPRPISHRYLSYWHTFRGLGSDPFGGATISRPWDDGTNSIENATRRVDAAFEFIQKLGVDYYTWHDADVSPQGATLKESNANLDKVGRHRR